MEDPLHPSFEGARHFMGTGDRMGGALFAPSLQAHVAAQLAGEAAIAKERRKAREYKGLAAVKGDKKGVVEGMIRKAAVWPQRNHNFTSSRAACQLARRSLGPTCPAGPSVSTFNLLSRGTCIRLQISSG